MKKFYTDAEWSEIDNHFGAHSKPKPGMDWNLVFTVAAITFLLGLAIIYNL